MIEEKDTNVETQVLEVTENVSNDTVDDNITSTDNVGNDISDTQTPVISDTADKVVANDNVDTNSEQQRNEQLNFKALRQAKKQAEKERDELARKIETLNAASKQEVSETEDIYEDDITKTQRDLKELKQQWAAQQQQIKFNNIQQQLRTDFPDFESVVNEEKIEILKARDLNFARITNRTPNDPDELYHRAVAAYTLIKKYGIHVLDVKDDRKKDRDRVQKNMAKPRPSAAAASSSASEGLSDFASFAGMNEDERRAAIYKLARERANS